MTNQERNTPEVLVYSRCGRGFRAAGPALYRVPRRRPSRSRHPVEQPLSDRGRAETCSHTRMEGSLPHAVVGAVPLAERLTLLPASPPGSVDDRPQSKPARPSDRPAPCRTTRAAGASASALRRLERWPPCRKCQTRFLHSQSEADWALRRNADRVPSLFRAADSRARMMSHLFP